MTTIIAIPTPEGVVWGADSQITDGDRRVLSPSTPKVVKVGRYYLGISGDCRPGDILMYEWKPPAYDGTDPVRFMGKKVMPTIIKAFKDGGYDFNKDGVSFSYLIGFAGQVFEIGDDLSLSQNIDNIYSVGAGSPYALGFLSRIVGDSLESVEDCKHLVLAALEVAAKYDVNTSAPFQIEVQKI